MSTTATGIPVTICGTCNVSHPVPRRHCVTCGRASLFLNNGACLTCTDVEKVATDQRVSNDIRMSNGRLFLGVTSEAPGASTPRASAHSNTFESNGGTP